LIIDDDFIHRAEASPSEVEVLLDSNEVDIAVAGQRIDLRDTMEDRNITPAIRASGASFLGSHPNISPKKSVAASNESLASGLVLNATGGSTPSPETREAGGTKKKGNDASSSATVRNYLMHFRISCNLLSFLYLFLTQKFPADQFFSSSQN